VKLGVAKHHGTSSRLTERIPKSKKITVTTSRKRGKGIMPRNKRNSVDRGDKRKA